MRLLRECCILPWRIDEKWAQQCHDSRMLPRICYFCFPLSSNWNTVQVFYLACVGSTRFLLANLRSLTKGNCYYPEVFQVRHHSKHQVKGTNGESRCLDPDSCISMGNLMKTRPGIFSENLMEWNPHLIKARMPRMANNIVIEIILIPLIVLSCLLLIGS